VWQAGEVPRTRSVWQVGEGMSLDSTFYMNTLSLLESPSWMPALRLSCPVQCFVFVFLFFFFFGSFFRSWGVFFSVAF